MDETGDKISHTSKINMKIVLFSIIIVIIIILSGLYLNYSYRNYDFHIEMSPIPIHNETPIVHLELKNTGSNELKFCISMSMVWIIETENETIKPPIGLIQWISGDQELLPDEIYQWNFSMDPVNIGQDDLSIWPKGDYTFYCTIHDQSKWGNLASNKIMFSIE